MMNLWESRVARTIAAVLTIAATGTGVPLMASQQPPQVGASATSAQTTSQSNANTPPVDRITLTGVAPARKPPEWMVRQQPVSGQEGAAEILERLLHPV